MGYDSVLRRNKLSSQKGCEGNLNAYYLVKEANMKRHTVWVQLWYPGKSKTMETVKGSVLPEVCGEESMSRWDTDGI